MDGEAEGPRPDAGARAVRVKPAQTAAEALRAPVSDKDALRTLPDGDLHEARHARESLRRRLGDKLLLEAMAKDDFAGWKYDLFQDELARYGLPVLRGWMYTGYIFKLLAGRGFNLHPTESELKELSRDSDLREELASMTIAVALPKFRKHALLGGGWKFEGGASLPTYFMGRCLYVYPNEFRTWRVAQHRWGRGIRREATLLDPEPGRSGTPETIVTGNLRVAEDLKRADARTGAIVALTIDGFSQTEIAAMIGEKPGRAVEAALYRWRKKEQLRLPQRRRRTRDRGETEKGGDRSA
jgi:DNA-directed RNA polymerase specialized sigma24 family protein